MQRDVVVGRFDPVDLRGVEDDRLLASWDEKARTRHFAFGEELGDAMIDLATLPPARTLLRARQRLGETAVVERLEQVIERVDLEGADGVAVVRGDKDD